ncbi:MAG: hypothetical protein DHS20C18_43440 [Saprospiraceae bacterium]|nr:MAG: hypothetical protein DHS20C18_43440 [Saprospiraceae bacterium]
MNQCKKCKSELNGAFCSNCGQAAKLKRIDSQYIISEIGSILNFEKGILFTVKELLINPGQRIKEFITEDRNRLVKPIIFVIICSLVYTLVIQLFHIEDGYIKFEGEKQSTTTLMFSWVQGNYGYANILMGVFIAFWIKVFFKKYDYNFFEIIIILCFVMGIGMLIFSVFAIFEGLTESKIMQIAGITGIAYCTWAIGQFFGKEKKVNYLKAFLAYFLGMFSFNLLIVIVGTLIDLM